MTEENNSGEEGEGRVLCEDRAGGLRPEPCAHPSREAVAAAIYDNWVKAVDGPDWVPLEPGPAEDTPLGLISPDDYAGVYAAADAVMALYAPRVSEWIQEGLNKHIAKAIRQAENGALDRAAQALPGSPYDGDRIAAVAAILKLKHKEPTH